MRSDSVLPATLTDDPFYQRLHQASQSLLAQSTSSSSFHLTPPPPPPPKPELAEIVKERWNMTVSSIVTALETTDWSAVGAAAVEGGKGLVERVQELTESTTVEGKVGGIVVGKEKVDTVEQLGLSGAGVSTAQKFGLDEKVEKSTVGIASGKRLV